MIILAFLLGSLLGFLLARPFAYQKGLRDGRQSMVEDQHRGGGQ